jgi:hypothetical protein
MDIERNQARHLLEIGVVCFMVHDPSGKVKGSIA